MAGHTLLRILYYSTYNSDLPSIWLIEQSPVKYNYIRHVRRETQYVNYAELSLSKTKIISFFFSEHSSQCAKHIANKVSSTIENMIKEK